MDFEERRRFPRYGFQTDAEIDWGSTILKAMVSDISIGGMFVVAANPLWVGATFTARLMLGEPMSVNCVVRRVLPGRGMGVEFVTLSEDDRTRLSTVVGMLGNP
ncbi:MAG: PilZ domain-containing protein [Acidobacteria bacterium]|nr:PilZ domain-containing protein [Acidobacteriota bacterium]